MGFIDDLILCDKKKVAELFKKGYTFGEIVKILKGKNKEYEKI